MYALVIDKNLKLTSREGKNGKYLFFVLYILNFINLNYKNNYFYSYSDEYEVHLNQCEIKERILILIFLKE